jgi:hypothetical protein
LDILGANCNEEPRRPFPKTSQGQKTRRGGKSYLKKEEHKKLETRKGQDVEEKDREIPLPSWIPGLSGAAFEMEVEEHPTAGLRMERRNADALVGLPDESGWRNYTAAGDKELDLDKLEFRKWVNPQKAEFNISRVQYVRSGVCP